MLAAGAGREQVLFDEAGLGEAADGMLWIEIAQAVTQEQEEEGRGSACGHVPFSAQSAQAVVENSVRRLVSRLDC